MDFIPADGTPGFSMANAYPLDENDRRFILGIINGAQRMRIADEDNGPTYGWRHPVYFTIKTDLKTKADGEGISYRLMLYNRKDWSVLHGETEYKLALARSSNGNNEELWELPQRNCEQVRKWRAQLQYGGISFEDNAFKPAVMVNGEIYWSSPEGKVSVIPESCINIGRIEKASSPTEWPDENFEAIGLGAGWNIYQEADDAYTVYVYDEASNEYFPLKRAPTNPEAKISPNGLFRAETYGENKLVTAAGDYPAEKIRVVDVPGGRVLWEMDGYYNCAFLWSSDSRYLSVYYVSRIEGGTVVVNTDDFSEAAVPLPVQIRENLREYRPDIFQKGVEWVDASRLKISIQWIGKDHKTYGGSYAFNPATGEISDVKAEEGIIPG